MFSDFFLKIKQMLPSWFKARVDESSSTHLFLKSILKAIYLFLNDVKDNYRNTKLETFNIEIDYKALKMNLDEEVKTVLIDGSIAERVYSEIEFIRRIETFKEAYYIDDMSHIIYIANAFFKKISLNNKEFKGIEHFIWNCNIIDEFGMLYGLERANGESNLEYKDRLLSFKQSISNSSLYGLCSILGHKISAQKRVLWLDGSTNINIKSNKTLCSAVFVDGELFLNYTKNKTSILLLGSGEFTGIKREVIYFEGFDIYAASEDDILKNIKHISKQAPVSFGYARWDDVFFIEDDDSLYIHEEAYFDDDLSYLYYEEESD